MIFWIVLHFDLFYMDFKIMRKQIGLDNVCAIFPIPPKF